MSLTVDKLKTKVSDYESCTNKKLNIGEKLLKLY